MTDRIQTRLIEFIEAEISLIDGPIDGGTDLLLTGAVDSLGVIRITQWIEDEAGIEVDPADVTLENFQTIDRISDYIGSRAAAA